MQSLGLIKWFDNDKGFGVIGTIDGNEVFIHSSQFINKPEKVLKAKAVFFDIAEDKKGKKAINVADPETYEHFKYIMSINENDPKVSLELTFKGKSRWGKEYIRKEYRDSSIFNYAIFQLLRYKDPETVKAFFINDFDECNFDSVETTKKRFQITRDVINKLEFKTVNADNSINEVSGVKSSEIIIEIFKHYLSKTDEKYLFDIWRQSYHHPIIQSNTLLHNKYAKEYDFPDAIFLDNYKSIDCYLLEKIFTAHEREDICFNIISKKIKDYNEVIESEYSDIKSCMSVLFETNIYNELSDLLFKKNIANFLRDKTKLNDSDYFNRFLSFLNRNSIGTQKMQAIKIINENLDDEMLFKYWQEFNYFIPSNDFIYKHLDKLSRNDFINAPSEFHNDYFLAKYNELNFDNSLRSFCDLFFLALETPGSQIQQVEDKLALKYRVVISLYNSYFDKNNNYGYTNDQDKFKINFSKDNFIEYLSQIEDLNEILQLVKIINEINVAYKYHKPSQTEVNGAYAFSQEDKIKIINEISNKLDYSLEISVLDVLKHNLKGHDQTKKVKIVKGFIPKFLNPDDDENFKELVKLHVYFDDNSKEKNEFLYYLQGLVSNPKKVSLWFNDSVNEIELDLAIDYLKECPDDNQFKILQKIFSSIHLNKKLITAELFTRFENLANNPSLNLDVRIALYVVNTLKVHKQFINDKTIFELVSQRLNENVDELIKIDKLLDKCSGRTWKAYSYNADDKEEWFININGHEFAVNDNLISIEGKNYSLNKENKSICINGVYYNFKWAKKRNVFHTENYGVPDGLTFCDAIKSQFDEDLETNFYWCCNSKCYSPCQKDYNPFQWKKYTLRDFIKILRIEFDNDLYYRFVAVINRVNRLLEKLKCNSCNKLTRDATTSEFAFYRVNTFHCTDSTCSEYHKTVYLTHCLNWRCLNIIDSRISKVCPNGWYICDKCDNCCSQDKIDMRYQNLLTNKAFNPNNPRHQKLKFQVDNKLGHLEKNEKYDFRTGERK
ncbi:MULTISPECIES: cold shock domain-containing protein [Flavobacterium]|uniref:cold shock domain-containing protein n=1 Tax=Flavobacterium TaxID=237 RepID=UPI001FCB7E9F|nr:MULTISPECIES: cold shock domain-containing protein [Flavobacterium]UOK42515.1 cold shock domain-containing protein [Flavobacterium enshiense]